MQPSARKRWFHPAAGLAVALAGALALGPSATLAQSNWASAAAAGATASGGRSVADTAGYVSEEVSCADWLGTTRRLECRAVTFMGSGVRSALWIRSASAGSRLSVLHLDAGAGRVLAGELSSVWAALASPELMTLAAASVESGSDVLIVLGAGSVIMTPDAPDELRGSLAAFRRFQLESGAGRGEVEPRSGEAFVPSELLRWLMDEERLSYATGITSIGVGASGDDALRTASVERGVTCTAVLRASLPLTTRRGQLVDPSNGAPRRQAAGGFEYLEVVERASRGNRRVVVEFADDASCCQAGQVSLGSLKAQWSARHADRRSVAFVSAPTGAPMETSIPLLSCAMPSETTGAVLSVRLQSQGTVFECESVRPVELDIRAASPGSATALRLSCPGVTVAPREWTPRVWSGSMALPGRVAEGVRAVSRLPVPWVVLDGGAPVLVRTELIDRLVPLGLKLEALDAMGRVLASVPLGQDRVALPSGASYWRYALERDGVRYSSEASTAVGFRPRASGIFGAMTVGRVRRGEPARLLGSLVPGIRDWTGNPADTYAAAGLEALRTGRSTRDARIADFNNDGIPDLVGNVYGAGCTLVGIGQADGSYAFFAPTRRDGTCISGHGETILVADFDNDGLLDIFLPAYERFDLLQNVGAGRFVEIAEDLGISFPNYLPQVEGAAAVDLNEDGWVDIVVANEVLINNRSGGFDRLSQPFGPVPIFDEGLSVADMDGDGQFDVVKNQPDMGPRIYWGTRNAGEFVDGGWLFGGAELQRRSFGLAVGRLSGGERQDIVTAGGLPFGTPPRLCVQGRPRQFQCLARAFAAAPGEWQDLLLITDLRGDGRPLLLSRTGRIVAHEPVGGPPMRHRFQIELRNEQGLPNMFGRTIRASCAVDRSLVGLSFVDGGNGYMAQGAYPVLFSSDWCTSIFVDVAAAGRMVRHGPFSPGVHTIRVPQR